MIGGREIARGWRHSDRADVALVGVTGEEARQVEHLGTAVGRPEDGSPVGVLVQEDAVEPAAAVWSSGFSMRHLKITSAFSGSSTLMTSKPIASTLRDT